MKIVKAPNDHEYDYPILFLAGSIEMGKAEDWQTWVAEQLEDIEGTALSPRRDDWDSSWVQDPTQGSKFHEQVKWELDNQSWTTSDYITFYFAADTISPITLLEFGLALGDRLMPSSEMVVYVDDNYSRRGNVIITCEYYEIPWTNDKTEYIKLLREMIE